MPPIARRRASKLKARQLAKKTITLSAIGVSALAALAGTALSLGTASTAASAAAGSHPGFAARVILSGASLRHTFVRAGSAKRHSAPLTLPDDITAAGPYLFTAFQNGVGPQGQAATDGNRDSTVVEFTRSGHPVRQWDIRGKCDGLTADPVSHQVIATVNEDAHSSVYTIAPSAAPADQVRHYAYSAPLPSKGGTDAVSVFHGMVLISASAPGTTGTAAPQPSYPAVYQVTFHPRHLIARIRPVFYDEARATVANSGASGRVRLALTDPDSSEVVPSGAARFAGDFMLTSQGDKEQIFVRDPARRRPALSVLRLSQSVDDTAWATSHDGRLYATDNGAGTVDVITGPFRPGSVFTAVTPCDANGAPATCPGPGYPANYLGALNPWTGHISRVALGGAVLNPQGMLFESATW
ncbi:MAG TPA: hypothetical protein VIK57_21315 [Streptosporangiaceae bacterium]